MIWRVEEVCARLTLLTQIIVRTVTARDNGREREGGRKRDGRRAKGGREKQDGLKHVLCARIVKNYVYLCHTTIETLLHSVGHSHYIYTISLVVAGEHEKLGRGTNSICVYIPTLVAYSDNGTLTTITLHTTVHGPCTGW